MPQYITATEAAKLTGKSTATISRFCNRYSGSVHLKKDGRSWLIDRDWLLKELGEQIAPEISRKYTQDPEKEDVNQEKTSVKLIEYSEKIEALQNQMIDQLKGENNYLRNQVKILSESNDKLSHNLLERQRELNNIVFKAQLQLENQNPKPEPTKTSEKDQRDLLPYYVLGACLLIALLIGIAIFIDANK